MPMDPKWDMEWKDARFDPDEEARKLRQEYREAVQAGNREEARRTKKALIRLYVFYGEHFKMSDSPNFEEAKWWLKEALKLDGSHPVANYRYAHLLYRDKEYEKAAYHFKKALDGNPEESLDDSQELIAHIMLANCGLLTANSALREIRYLRDNKYRQFDLGRIEAFNESMLAQIQQMLEEQAYLHMTPDGVRHISRTEFLEFQDQVKENEVLLYVEERYHIKYRGLMLTVSPESFYLFWLIMKADDFVETQRLAFVLGKADKSEWMDEEIPEENEEKNTEEKLKNVERRTYDNVRQILSRLGRAIPFWDEVIETKNMDRRTFRRRREGITYSLLCHSGTVLPKLYDNLS